MFLPSMLARYTVVLGLSQETQAHAAGEPEGGLLGWGLSGFNRGGGSTMHT